LEHDPTRMCELLVRLPDVTSKALVAGRDRCESRSPHAPIGRRVRHARVRCGITTTSMSNSLICPVSSGEPAWSGRSRDGGVRTRTSRHQATVALSHSPLTPASPSRGLSPASPSPPPLPRLCRVCIGSARQFNPGATQADHASSMRLRAPRPNSLRVGCERAGRHEPAAPAWTARTQCVSLVNQTGSRPAPTAAARRCNHRQASSASDSALLRTLDLPVRARLDAPYPSNASARANNWRGPHAVALPV
jgi:hypothetical protein